MSDDLVRYRQEEVHLGGGDVEIRYVESKDGWIASYADAKAALDAKDAEIARLRADLATAQLEGMEAVHALTTLEGWAKRGKVEIARSLLGKTFEVGHLATNSVGVGGTVIDAIRAAAKEGKP